jgi:hypothetical protein
MKNQLIGAIAAVLMAVMAVATTDVSAQAPPLRVTNALTVPIVGTVNGGGNFAGQLNIQKFVRTGDTVNAIGTLVGQLTNAAGTVQNVIAQVAIPLDLGALVPQAGVCQILHLTLGPLDLDLLGLQVHLNQVVLNIDAQSGPGKLLGNLLCDVAHLLDTNGPLGHLTDLLNQILNALG